MLFVLDSLIQSLDQLIKQIKLFEIFCDLFHTQFRLKLQHTSPQNNRLLVSRISVSGQLILSSKSTRGLAPIISYTPDDLWFDFYPSLCLLPGTVCNIHSRHINVPCGFMSSEPSNLARWIWLRIHLSTVLYRFVHKLSSSIDARISTYINLTRLSKALLVAKRSHATSFMLPLGCFVGVFIC